MKKVLIVVFMMAALACGSDAAELFGVPDAGAQSVDTFEYTCPESGWLETDIDQRPLGQIVVYSRGTAFVDVLGGTVDWQQYAWSSLNGKVVVPCEPGMAFTIEVR